MRILCTGGRNFDDYGRVSDSLWYYNDNPGLEIVVGDAKGLDKLVRHWCDMNDIPVKVYYANWDLYGPKAGPIRNGEMLETKPDVVLAFPGGRGTANCVAQARKLGIPVREVQ